MKKDTARLTQNPQENLSALDEVIRQGAQKVLQTAIEIEVESFLERHQYVMDDAGRRLVVRNGHAQARMIATGAGPLIIRTPRVDDRALLDKRFRSSLIPPYLRRTKNLDEFIPFLYLKGVSTGDFTEVLSKLLGRSLPGFSAQNICRMKEIWKKDWETWDKRDLSNSSYVYWWADGIHFSIRGEEEKQCILVIIGAKEDGTKELVAIGDGFRESKESWQSVMRSLKRRGLKTGPKLATGDGSLGFWAALEEEFPLTKHQYCWVHKTANILDKLPKSLQPKAKSLIHEIHLAPTRKDAESAFDVFIEEFADKYPKAVDCARKHREDLLAFYDFPAEHWKSIRSTNVIESTFATVRHRTGRTKNCSGREATLTMVFKLTLLAQKRWRRIKGYDKLKDLIAGVRFVDGRIMREVPAKELAV